MDDKPKAGGSPYGGSFTIDTTPFAVVIGKYANIYRRDTPMDEVEALARAYCREMGLGPDDPAINKSGWETRRWRTVVDDAREFLAWSRAMETMKRDAG
jgi:hypothetical protein